MENSGLVQLCVLTKHHRLSPVLLCACACACACVRKAHQSVQTQGFPREVESCVGWLTGPAATEVNSEDVVDEAGEVGQLAQVALQGTAEQSRLVERSHEAKHKGIQAGRPARSITTRIKLYFIKHAHRREICASTWRYLKNTQL